MQLKTPLELSKLSRDDFINYIDKLHENLLRYQLLIDAVSDTIKSKNRNHK